MNSEINPNLKKFMDELINYHYSLNDKWHDNRVKKKYKNYLDDITEIALNKERFAIEIRNVNNV